MSTPRRFSLKFFRVIWEEDYGRVGAQPLLAPRVNRQLSRATERNRIKRILREFFRGHPETFILYRKIPLSSIDEDINVVSGYADKEAMFTTSLLFRKNTDPPSIDVSIAFCIDDTKYLEALRKHEVSADG